MKIKTNPTAREERDEMKSMVANAKPGDTIWIHHSGPKEFKPMTKSQTRQAALEKHYTVCEALGRHLGMNEPDGKTISVHLFILEREMHKCAEAYCNGEKVSITFNRQRHEFDFRNDEEAWEKACEVGHSALRKIFNGHSIKGAFFNGDARGYAVKLEPNSIQIDPPLHRDFGGYQILSPEIEL